MKGCRSVDSQFGQIGNVMTKLRELDLTCAYLQTTNQTLPNFSRLTSFHIVSPAGSGYVFLEGISIASKFTDLRQLTLSSTTNWSCNLRALASLTQLEYLDVSGLDHNTTEPDWAFLLDNYPNLKTLCVRKERVESLPAQHLAHLKVTPVDAGG